MRLIERTERAGKRVHPTTWCASTNGLRGQTDGCGGCEIDSVLKALVEIEVGEVGEQSAYALLIKRLQMRIRTLPN